MSNLVAVKREGGRGVRLIERTKYAADPKSYQLANAEERARVSNLLPMTDAEKAAIAEEEAARKVSANRGQVDGAGPAADGKNPDGTFSTPTPSDIRFPDKNATEFANNHGAFVNKSAAEMRADKGMPDAPGGLKPLEALKIAKKGNFSTMSYGDEEPLFDDLSKKEVDAFNSLTDDDSKRKWIADREAANKKAAGSAT